MFFNFFGWPSAVPESRISHDLNQSGREEDKDKIDAEEEKEKSSFLASVSRDVPMAPILSISRRSLFEVSVS